MRRSFQLFAALMTVAPAACRALTPLLSSSHQLSVKMSTALSSSPITTDSHDVMGGVDEFETWFTAEPGSSCLPSIHHAKFDGSLRGLAYITSNEPLPTTPVLKVPESIVLSTPYSDPDWDIKLSQKLWKECLKGGKSRIHGYCSLLMLGNAVSPSSDVPPSTAPNALRHWTETQKAVLERSSKGTKLLQAEQAQSLSWKNKYSSVQNEMTYPQFEWCMEVVHSRAFCGIGSVENSFKFVAAGAPVLAGAAGFAYIQDNAFPDDRLLVALAVLGALPVLASYVLVDDRGSAILLPLVDSANHLSTADSRIEYNPLSKAFELGIGPKCLVKDGQQTQLYVSYGEKTDAELLLNYGFLPNVSLDDGTDEAGRDRQRTSLAKAFIERNP